MAETETKSTKKNRKKRANKQEQPLNPTTVTIVDPIEELKKQIECAKSEKDHKKAQKLREQLWTLQDTASLGTAGLEVDTLVLDTQLTQNVSEPSSVSDTPLEKSLKKLEKKLSAIEELKKKRDKGIKLESNQLAKISTEDEIRQEIEMIQHVLKSL